MGFAIERRISTSTLVEAGLSTPVWSELVSQVNKQQCFAFLLMSVGRTKWATVGPGQGLQ